MKDQNLAQPGCQLNFPDRACVVHSLEMEMVQICCLNNRLHTYSVGAIPTIPEIFCGVHIHSPGRMKTVLVHAALHPYNCLFTAFMAEVNFGGIALLLPRK